MSTTIERVRLFAAVVCAVGGLILTARGFEGTESSQSNRLLCESGQCAGQWTPSPCYATLGNKACCCNANHGTPDPPVWKCLCVGETECKQRKDCQW
jgi:hypothetical protein